MFTGLVEEVGRVAWLRQLQDSQFQLQVIAPHVTRGAHRGDSVAVNGCCLTVVAHREDRLTFDLLQETLLRTNLSKLRPDSLVNLERPLAADGRLGGHFVQGHVDCVSPTVAFEPHQADHRLEIELAEPFAPYVVAKGSIAINGVSLTVAEKRADRFVCWIIPHTRDATNLRGLTPGEPVNLEFDVLAKYVEAQLARTGRMR